MCQTDGLAGQGGDPYVEDFGLMKWDTVATSIVMSARIVVAFLAVRGLVIMVRYGHSRPVRADAAAAAALSLAVPSTIHCQSVNIYLHTFLAHFSDTIVLPPLSRMWRKGPVTCFYIFMMRGQLRYSIVAFRRLGRLAGRLPCPRFTSCYILLVQHDIMIHESWPSAVDVFRKSQYLLWNIKE